MYKKKCIICESSFEASYPNESTCSEECKKEAKKLRNKRYREKKKNNIMVENIMNVEEFNKYIVNNWLCPICLKIYVQCPHKIKDLRERSKKQKDLIFK